MEYEERIVAYIDILGFKNRVDNSTKPLEIESIQKILEGMDETKRTNYGYEFDKQKGAQVTTFSDNIVISYPANSTENLFLILLDALHLQLYMVGKDTLLRGGITIGKLIHNSEMVYGPAMNEAYRLESEIAIYPRIIIDTNKLSGFFDKYFEKDAYECIEKILKLDSDRCFYIDYLAQSGEIEEGGDEYYVFLSQIRSIIENGLNDKSINVIKKYEWLRIKYNEIIKKGRIYLDPIEITHPNLLEQGETEGENEYLKDKVAYLEALYEISTGKKPKKVAKNDKVRAIFKATGRKRRSRIMRICAIAGVSLKCYYSYRKKGISRRP